MKKTFLVFFAKQGPPGGGFLLSGAKSGLFLLGGKI